VDKTAECYTADDSQRKSSQNFAALTSGYSQDSLNVSVPGYSQDSLNVPVPVTQLMTLVNQQPAPTDLHFYSTACWHKEFDKLPETAKPVLSTGIYSRGISHVRCNRMVVPLIECSVLVSTRFDSIEHSHTDILNATHYNTNRIWNEIPMRWIQQWWIMGHLSVLQRYQRTGIKLVHEVLSY
jgi:hypothetical protein